MAAMATRLGLGAEAQAYAARAAAIRAAANATFAATAAQCNPAGVGVCYTDKPNAPPTPPAPPAPTPVPAPVPVADCGVVLEKDRFQRNTTGQLALNCGTGQVVSDVLFAVRHAERRLPSAGGGGGGGGFHANASCTDPQHACGKRCLHGQAAVYADCRPCALRGHVRERAEALRCRSHARLCPRPRPRPVGAHTHTAHASVSALDARLRPRGLVSPSCRSCGLATRGAGTRTGWRCRGGWQASCCAGCTARPGK